MYSLYSEQVRHLYFLFEKDFFSYFRIINLTRSE